MCCLTVCEGHVHAVFVSLVNTTPISYLTKQMHVLFFSDFAEGQVSVQWLIQDFPEGAPTQRALLIIWHNLCRKLHENEKNWTEAGGASLEPLDPPMVYTARIHLNLPIWMSKPIFDLPRWKSNCSNQVCTIIRYDKHLFFLKISSCLSLQVSSMEFFLNVLTEFAEFRDKNNLSLQ